MELKGKRNPWPDNRRRLALVMGAEGVRVWVFVCDLRVVAIAGGFSAAVLRADVLGNDSYKRRSSRGQDA